MYYALQLYLICGVFLRIADCFCYWTSRLFLFTTVEQYLLLLRYIGIHCPLSDSGSESHSLYNTILNSDTKRLCLAIDYTLYFSFLHKFSSPPRVLSCSLQTGTLQFISQSSYTSYKKNVFRQPLRAPFP